MKYISRELRNEIALILAEEHNHWIKYRNGQPKHPKGGVHVARGVADGKIERLRTLIKELAPKMVKDKQQTTLSANQTKH